MRLIHFATLAAICTGTAALGSETCPTGPDRSLERATLLESLATSVSPLAGKSAANEVWRHWTTAPDDKAQSLLDQGMQSIRFGEPVSAQVALDQLVHYCPGYAEGWNQRAFAKFLSGDFPGSLADIEAALEIEPAHFGALAGKIMILVRQNKRGLAQLVLIEARKVNPWLREGELLGVEGQSL